jgi:hypothetical protein
MGNSRLFGLEYAINDRDSDVFSADRVHSKLVVDPTDQETAIDPENRDDQSVVFTWPDLGTFDVRWGREITGELDESANATYVRNVLLGICLGALLQQRGYLVFHGSVVDMNGEAIALVGNKRAGKSTSAAALLTQGHEFLSDDIVAVRFDGDTLMVVPGFPVFKFDPDAFDDSRLPAEPAPNPDTGHGKQYYELDGEFDWDPRLLSRICLLDPDADGPRSKTLEGHEAVMAVIEHSWPVRLRNAPYVDHDRSTIEGPDLERYARLVEHCLVQRISLEHDHSTLEELGRDLESILGTETA